MAKGGAQTLTWLAVVAALFFVPAGLVIAELGAAFPIQGGPYVWARLAFGRYAGSLVALGFVWATVALAALPLRAGNDNSRYFSAALTLSIALLALANLVVFPALVRLRSSQPERPRPFRVPGGPAGALAVTALATGWSALVLAAVLWPGLGTADPGAHLPDGFAGDRLSFTLALLVPLAAVLAAPSLLARRHRRR